MALQSIGFKFFAKIMKRSCVFVVQVVLVLILRATLSSQALGHPGTRIARGHSDTQGNREICLADSQIGNVHSSSNSP